MTAYLAVPLKDRNGRHKGWFVYALPLGNMSRCYGHYRGLLAKQRARARARNLTQGRRP